MACQLKCKAEIVDCSSEKCLLSEKDELEKIIVYTECGLLPSLYLNLTICSSHFSYFLDVNQKRGRRHLCEVPLILSSHENIKRKSDRSLTLKNVEFINAKYGVVLPVGSGICRNCRKSLLEISSNTEVSENEQVKTEPGDGFTYPDELDEIPRKRTRKSVEPLEPLASDVNVLIGTPSDTQEIILSQSSTVSCWSDAYRQDVPREALNKFLSASGLSPVKELQGQLSESSKRTQQRYIRKAAQCFDLICNTICPGEADFIKTAILNETNEQEDLPYDTTLDTLAHIYKKADTWDLQRQILSIIAHQHRFEDVQMLIPEMTLYRYKAARKHSKQFGIGEAVSITKQTREKYDVGQLDHFIDFITSSHIIKDQPFGEKTLKLNGGEVIKIPSVIRSLAPSRIIAQYIAICNEENIKPLGSSTLYKLLDECSALVRQSIEGLDNYIMEGCRAFQDLESIVQELSLTTYETKSLLENLQNAKRYLKSELKVHVKRESQIADHCLCHALSSTDSNFQSACINHIHDLICQDCTNIDSTLKVIRDKAETKQWKNKEATMYTVEESISAIRKWKAHVLRSRNQEEARSTIVNKMTDADAIITCDWAMKFLPRKYREGQVDWFAKRGINWHITVSLLKHQSSFMTMTHIHIFENPTPQDAAVTSQILIDVSKDIMGQRNEICNLHFFSDNAGCYKSSVALLSLQQELRDNIASYNFCEAQNGKGACDRRASHIKSIIKRYVNEGNDVTTALQMKQAVDREGKDDIRVKVATAVNVLDALSKRWAIPNISQMFNFQFTEDGLRMWKAFSVGQGKLLKWNDVGAPAAKTIEIKTIADWTGPDFSERNDVATELTEISIAKEQGMTLECPEESCLKIFSTQKALEKHISMGDCNFQGVKMDISERAKRLYADKILSVEPQRMVDLRSSNTAQANDAHLEIGWALREGKQRIIFSANQRAYMMEKFNVGKVTGNKIDPYVAAEEMRTSGKFARAEFLSGQQIASFFSRMCQKDKKMTPEDFKAAEEEERKDNIRNLLDKTI